MPPKADDTPITNCVAPPVTIDLDAELAVMAGVHAALAPLDYEARVRVLAWLARRFDIDTDALRFWCAWQQAPWWRWSASAPWAFTARSRWSLFAGFSNKNGATLAFRTFMAPLLKNGEEISWPVPTQSQDAYLTAEAARLSITIVDPIRRIIDEYRTAHEPPTRET